MGPALMDHPNVRRLDHSPFVVYYRVIQRRMLVEILHLAQRSRRQPFLQ